MIGRILLSVAASALAGFVGLVLIGLWDRHAQEATVAGFSGIHERYLAVQAGFPNGPKGVSSRRRSQRCRAGRRSPKNGGARGVSPRSEEFAPHYNRSHISLEFAERAAQQTARSERATNI